MGQMFYPKMSMRISASAPHPEGTEYKISIGEEDWDGEFKTVIKVQMLYNGKIAGRKSPSYPAGSDDAQRVANAMMEIEQKFIAQQSEAKRVIFFPEKKPKRIPAGHYIALLFNIPDGYLTTWEAMDRYFQKLYGVERVETERQSYWPLDVDGKEIPYWKIIGTTGFLHDDWYRCSITTRAEKLKEHGFMIEAAGKGKQLLKVQNYKKYFYDLSKIDAKNMIETDILN